MADTINVGTGTDTGDGDKARIGGGKINAKFAVIDGEITTLNGEVATLQTLTADLGSSTAISALPAAATLTGPEIFDIVQGGVNVRTTIAALTGTPGSDTVARTSINTIKAKYIDFDDYSPDKTGVVGCAAGFQTALAASLAANVPLRIPQGLYLIDTPIDVGVASFDGPQIIGNSSTMSSSISQSFSISNHGADVVFKASFTDKPVFYNSHPLRAAYFSNFMILGTNPVAPFKAPNDFKQNYNALGLRDSQYSPNCGFALDSFSGVAPPADGGYPGMSAKYTTVGGSSGVIFDNLTINGFVVDLTIGLTGAQADNLLFRNLLLTCADTAVAVGASQSKVANFMWGAIAGCRQAFDGVNYGPGTGFPINTFGVNYQSLYRMFNYQSTNGTLVGYANYAESVRCLGNFGTGSSSARGHSTYQGGSFTQDNLSALPAPILFDTYGLSSFRDVNFNPTSGAGAMKSWNLCSDTASQPIKLDTCTVGHTGIAGIVPFVGLSPTGAVVTLDNCIAQLGGITNQPMSDNSSIDISGFTINNRFAGIPRAGRYSNGVAVVDFYPQTLACVANVAATGTAINTRSVTFTASLASGAVSATLNANWTDLTGWYMTTFSNADVRPVLYKNGQTSANWDSWGLSSSATTAATAAGVTLTFTATDVTLVQLGDMYFWKMLKQYAGSTQRSVIAWVVTNIAGSVVTCQPTCDPTNYDTVANNGGGTTLQVAQNVWAPSGAVLTASMNNSVNITAVSPVNLLKVGDWVTAATGIAASSRVVTTDGAGNITLNKATTGGSLTGVVMYFGRLNTPTVTATW